MIYRVDPPENLRIVPLDSLTAIYHRPSGQSHVVAEPVPEIISALAEGACDIAVLMDRLGVGDAADTRAVLVERLDELVATGLVARA